MSLDKFLLGLKGGAGSGNHGHGGRPGKRGGSVSKGGGSGVPQSSDPLKSRVDDASQKYTNKLTQVFGVSEQSLTPRNSGDRRLSLPPREMADKALNAGYGQDKDKFKSMVDFMKETHDNPAMTELRASYNKLMKTEGAFKPPSFVGDYLKEKGIVEKEPFQERNRRQEIADANNRLRGRTY